MVVVRADSAYFTRVVIAAARRGGKRLSITGRLNPAVIRAISWIPDTA